MKDSHEKALEKAKQHAEKAKQHAEQQKLQAQQGSQPTAPLRAPLSNTAFESERQRAIAARQNEIGAYNGQNVQMIRAAVAATAETRILRVAAYCRVSTDEIEQVISIELQKKHYSEMIRANPKWKYVGTYVDNGISGTNTEHRPAFNKMMKDAMDGKIDMIITKSVSRLARNLVDCINWVRVLQKHDPQIAVYFEQENLNTLDNTSNIILFVLAMVAEEESHMKSEAMLLSLEWRFSRGRFLTPALLGYDKVELVDKDGIKKKMLVINEDQAVIVRYMYYSLLNGATTAEIAENLTYMGIETGGRKRDGTPNTHWTSSGVVTILRNERYCGDVLARKTWTPDFHDHKSKKNNGKKNKYYHPGHHEGIVTRAQWNAAQRILNSGRYNRGGSASNSAKGYRPMQVVEDGALRGYVSVNRGWAGYDLSDYYRVSSIVLGLNEGNLEEDLGREFLPEGGHKLAGDNLAGAASENGVQRIARQLSEAEQEIKDELEGITSEKEDEKPQARPQKAIERQYQVITNNMFSALGEPTFTIRHSSLDFNKKCVEQLLGENKLGGDQDSKEVYAEILFNPVEHMIAVRLSSKENPNAILWRGAKHKNCSLSSTAFCKMLFEMQDWNEEWAYRIRAGARSNVLLFNLDNAVANKSRCAVDEVKEQLAAAMKKSDETPDEDSAYFFGADDDELDCGVEDIQHKLLELVAKEKVTFGTPLMEYTEYTGGNSVIVEGDVMTPARALDTDHRVDNEVVQELENRLLDRSIN